MNEQRLAVFWLFGSLAISGISCGDSTAPAPLPASLEIVSGEAQHGTVGATLTVPLAARVLDGKGRTMQGQLVQFVVTAGGGTLSVPSALTNSDGIVEDRWTLGTVAADSQVVQARIPVDKSGTLLRVARFHAVALPDVPDTVRQVSGDGQSVVAKYPLTDSLVARVMDRFGNPVPGVQVAWTVSADGGALSHSVDTTTVTGYTSVMLVAGSQFGERTVQATVGAHSVAFSVHVMRAVPVLMVSMGGDFQTDTVDRQLCLPIVYRVFDRNRQPIEGQPVNFVVIAGGGTLSAPTGITNASGDVQVRWTIGKSTSSGQTGEARVVDDDGVQLLVSRFSASARADTPDTATVVSGNGQTAVVNTALADSLVARIVDRFGNPTAGAVALWTHSPNGGTLARTFDVVTAAGYTSNQMVAGSQPMEVEVFAESGFRGASFTVHVVSAPPASPDRVSERRLRAGGAPTLADQLQVVGATDAAGSARVRWTPANNTTDRCSVPRPDQRLADFFGRFGRDRRVSSDDYGR